MLAESVSRGFFASSSIEFVGPEQGFSGDVWRAFSARTGAAALPYSGNISMTERDLKRIFSADSVKFFFLSKNADRNVSLAFFAMDAAKRLNVDIAKFTMYMAPNWEDIESFLQRRKREISANFDIKLVNFSRLAAHTLSRKYKPVDFIEFDKETALAKSDFNVAVVGITPNSREALFKVYQQGRFEGSAFRLSVFDVASDARYALLSRKYPGFLKDVSASFKAINSYASAGDAILPKLEDFELVIVDLGSDSASAALTKLLQEKLSNSGNSRTTIAPFMENPSEFFAESPEYFPNVAHFGSVSEVYTCDAIIDDSFRSGGKFVNAYYNSSKSDPMKMKNWLAMSEFEKGSNVSVADFNSTFIKLIGRENFARIKNSEDFKAYLRGRPKLYANLSRIEHLRWCAYLYSSGWDVLPLNGEILAENKDAERKLHACLVPFDELGKISEAFNEDYKKYDSDNVDIIFDIYKTLHSEKNR